jgi:ribosomal protein L11 methyltransferase
MAWIELKLLTTSQDLEAHSSLLSDLGAVAITTQDAADQPIYQEDLGQTFLWNNIILTGLFHDDLDIDATLMKIKSAYSHLHVDICPLKDQDWERAFMADFKATQFGDRLWVTPSHDTPPLSANSVVLDPGLAFGTGKHPTTALCLQWLDQNLKNQEILIDYGCGSGILGIAALKLGAKKVYAIDHDPQALLATDENAKKNGLTANEITLLHPEALQNLQANVLIANILANPQIALVEKFNQLLLPKGKIVLSGILGEQTQQVIAAYQPYFEIIKVEQMGDWVRIDGYKVFI